MEPNKTKIVTGQRYFSLNGCTIEVVRQNSNGWFSVADHTGRKFFWSPHGYFEDDQGDLNEFSIAAPLKEWF
jgi:hypothetical protein